MGLFSRDVSTKAFVIKGTNRAVVTSTTKGLKGWEAAIRQEILSLDLAGPMEGPMSLSVDFYLKRPKALKGSKAHTSRPDLDKLVRGASDALTGLVWKDDSQVKAKTVVMELDSDRPRTVVAIAPCLGTMTKAPLFTEAQ